MNKAVPLHKLFFYLFILSIPTQLSYHFWPDWAMVLGRRIDYLSPTLYLSDILLIYTLLIWFYAERKNLVTSLFRTLKSHWVLLLLIIFFIITTLYASSNALLSALGLVKIFEVVGLVFYIHKTYFSMQIITKLLLIISLASITLAIAQFIHGGSMGGLFWLLGERTFNLETPNIAKSFFCIPTTNFCTYILRPYATFPHPNVFAGFLGLTLIATQIFLKRNRLTWSITIIMLIGIMLTGSRSALFFTLLIYGTTLCLKYFKSISIKTWVLIILAFSTIICFLLTYPPSIHLQKYINSQESLLIRQQLNLASIEIFKNNWVVGTGLNTFLLQLPKVLVYKSVYFLQPVHNIYLLALSSVGIIGIAFLVAMFLYIYIKKLSVLRLQQIYTPLLFILCVGLFDHYPLTLQQGQLLFGLAIAFVFTRKNTI